MQMFEGAIVRRGDFICFLLDVHLVIRPLHAQEFTMRAIKKKL